VKTPAKRDTIQAAAQQLFLRSGLRRTSMDAIAAEANVSKQTIYRYFQSKEQLFVEVLNHLVAEGLQAEVRHLSPQAPLGRRDLEATLLRIAQVAIDAVLDSTYLALVRVLIAEGADFPELAGRFRASAIDRVGGQLRSLLRSPYLAEVIELPEGDAALRLFVAPLLSYELEGLLGDPANARSRAAAELPILVKLFVAAITKPITSEG
jgi:TetR/AcrR family transcriptional regulator, mexJK operon transcriptional repressor